MAPDKAGCNTVIIPKENVKDLAEISDEVKGSLNFVSVSHFNELMPIALCSVPKPVKINSIIRNKETQSRSNAVTQ